MKRIKLEIGGKYNKIIISDKDIDYEVEKEKFGILLKMGKWCCDG